MKPGKFTVTFETDYEWLVEAATETIVFYTNRTTNHDGAITDCDEITNDDFLPCPNYPKVPCWPPQVKPSRASAIHRYDPLNKPTMDSSVCIGAITKVRDMGIGTTVPSSSYSEMRYLVESVAEVRVEPCLQDVVDYTSYTNDIMMWTSTPGASIKYTVDYDTACLNLDSTNVGSLAMNGAIKCDRVLTPDGSDGFRSPQTGQIPDRVLPASPSAVARIYDQPFSIPHTARVIAIGQHEHPQIGDSILTSCDYEVRVANPSCTTEAGSAWMGVTAPLGSPQSPTVNTEYAVLRFLSPTQDSTVHFRYCDENDVCDEWINYNPRFPPLMYQSSQIQAYASKSQLTSSETIRCSFTVKAAAPIFTPPSTYGGTWIPKGTVDRTGHNPPVITAGVPAIDSFFPVGTRIKLSQWSDAQCDDSLVGDNFPAYTDEKRGCRQARDFTIHFRMSEECCSLPADQECSAGPGGCTTVDDNGTENDDSDDVSTTVNDCAWATYQPAGNHANGIVLESSKQICTRTLPTTNSIGSNVRTADFFIYAESPTYDKASYTSYVNEMEFCLATTTPGAAVYYKALRSTLLSNNRGAEPDRLISFETDYPFSSTVLGTGIVEYTGASAPDADAFATLSPACTVVRESKLISAATYKNVPGDSATGTPGFQLAPSHRNHDNEYANTLNPDDIGMGTKARFYIEVDVPTIYPDQRVGLDGSEPLHDGVGRAASPVYGITADGTGDESAYWVADSDGNGNGDIFTSTEITISTATEYANGEAISGVQIRYAIESYHCTDPDGSGPLGSDQSMLACSAAEREVVDRAAAEFDDCNMYDPDHTCNGDDGDTPFEGTTFHGPLIADTPVPKCTALEGIYDSTTGTFVHSIACRSYLSVRYPKVARYVMTCNGLSEDAAGTLVPYSGCNFQTYDPAAKPVVDLTTFVYSYGKKAYMEDSEMAQMEYEITVDGVEIDVCGKPEGVPYYVGPTPIALSSPTAEAPLRAVSGPVCFGNSGGTGVVGSQPMTCNVDTSVTIKYYWSTTQYEGATAGQPLPQPGSQATTLAKRECATSNVPGGCTGKQYDWLSSDPSSQLTRFEYAQNGRKISGENDPRENACGTPEAWTKTSPSDSTGAVQTFSAGCATAQDTGAEAHRPRLVQDFATAGIQPTWQEGDAFTVTEIGTLYAYAEKPGLTPSLLTSCEYEIQATPPSWFQSGEICNEVSSGDIGIPVCLSPALFGSGFIFLYSEADTRLHYHLKDNALADHVTRTSSEFDTWIQLVAESSTFFYSLKSFAIKEGMWDSVQVNQPFVVVTEVSRGAIASDNLPAEVTSNVCQGCSSDNILFGKPGQFWGAEYTTDPKGVVSVTLDFPGKWDEAVNECGAENTLTAYDTGTNYLITAVYLAYPFIPDPARGYARAASACSDYEVEVQQTVRDSSCASSNTASDYGGVCKEQGLRVSWETGGETFSSSGEQTNCIGIDSNGIDRGSKQQSEGCWRETIDPDDEDRVVRKSDSFTPPSPIRGTALKYTCKQLPFYLESWVVYGIPGAQLDVTSAASGTCTLGSGASGIVDCSGNCVSTKNIGDGTCDAGQTNSVKADGSINYGTGAINSAGDYVPCTANGDAVMNIGSLSAQVLLPGRASGATDDNDANCVPNFNCVDFLYDKMDCFELDAGGGDVNLDEVFSTLYEEYDDDRARAAAEAAADDTDATGR